MQVVFKAIMIAALCLCWPAALAEQTDPAPAPDNKVLVIYDSSNSMWGELSDASRKYAAARNAISEFIATGIGERDVAFRAYGHRYRDDCRDSELLVPFQTAETGAASIQSALEDIRPTGMTPITWSLSQGLEDLGGGPGDILLISDGIETCDADPCDLMRDWQSAGVDVQVHVVGVGLSDLERTAMTCIADVSGGQYFDADSELAFNEALTDASTAMAEPDPVPQPITYAIALDLIDETGESLRGIGQLRQDASILSEVETKGYGVNLVPGPGDYVIEAGARLADGSAYTLVETSVSVSEPGVMSLTLEVPRPASVSASFLEMGEPHSGALIRAYQDSEEVFSFRPGDVAFAREGTYNFRTAPNADNELTLTQTLEAGAHTDLVYDLTQTIKAYIQFTLPDGETIKRASELWRAGEKLYTLHATNGETIQPGTYELRSDDQNLPLVPVEVTLTNDGEPLTVPLAAGFLTIEYGGDPFNYVAQPNRAFLESLDRGGRSYATPGGAIPVAPGAYRVHGYDRTAHFDPLDVTIAADETVTATLEPKPVGELTVSYAPSEAYTTIPDRAFVTALDGQPIIGGIFQPGEARKLLPGRYLVEGWSTAGDFAPQEITITAGAQHAVTLELNS